MDIFREFDDTNSNVSNVPNFLSNQSPDIFYLICNFLKGTKYKQLATKLIRRLEIDNAFNNKAPKSTHPQSQQTLFSEIHSKYNLPHFYIAQLLSQTINFCNHNRKKQKTFHTNIPLSLSSSTAYYNSLLIYKEFNDPPQTSICGKFKNAPFSNSFIFNENRNKNSMGGELKEMQNIYCFLYERECGIGRYHSQQFNRRGYSCSPNAMTTNANGLPSLNLPPISFYENYHYLMLSQGHANQAFCLIFNHCSTQIYTGADDWLIRSWNVRNGLIQHCYRAQESQVIDLHINQSNTLLASVSFNLAIVYIWDANHGQLLAALHPNLELFTKNNAIKDDIYPYRVLFVDECQLLITYNSGLIYSWTLNYKKLIKNEFSTVEHLPKPIIYYCMENIEKSFSDVESLSSVISERDNSCFNMRGIDIHPNKKSFVIGTDSGLYLFHLESKKDMFYSPVQYLKNKHRSRCNIVVKYSHNGRYIMSGDDYGTCNLYQLKLNEYSLVHSFKLQKKCNVKRMMRKNSSVLALNFNADDEYCIITGEKGTSIVYRVADHCILHYLEMHKSQVDIPVCITHPFDGRLCVTGAYDGRLILWDIVNGCAIKMFLFSSTMRISVAVFSPNGHYIACVAGQGILILIGIGSSRKEYGLAPDQQFFVSDFNSLKFDDTGSGYPFDGERDQPPWTLPHIMCDLDSNLYSGKYFNRLRQICDDDDEDYNSSDNIGLNFIKEINILDLNHPLTEEILDAQERVLPDWNICQEFHRGSVHRNNVQMQRRNGFISNNPLEIVQLLNNHPSQINARESMQVMRDDSIRFRNRNRYLVSPGFGSTHANEESEQSSDSSVFVLSNAVLGNVNSNMQLRSRSLRSSKRESVNNTISDSDSSTMISDENVNGKKRPKRKTRQENICYTEEISVYDVVDDDSEWTPSIFTETNNQKLETNGKRKRNEIGNESIVNLKETLSTQSSPSLEIICAEFNAHANIKDDEYQNNRNCIENEIPDEQPSIVNEPLKKKRKLNGIHNDIQTQINYDNEWLTEMIADFHSNSIHFHIPQLNDIIIYLPHYHQKYYKIYGKQIEEQLNKRRRNNKDIYDHVFEQYQQPICCKIINIKYPFWMSISNNIHKYRICIQLTLSVCEDQPSKYLHFSNAIQNNSIIDSLPFFNNCKKTFDVYYIFDEKMMDFVIPANIFYQKLLYFMQHPIFKNDKIQIIHFDHCKRSIIEGKVLSSMKTNSKMDSLYIKSFLKPLKIFINNELTVKTNVWNVIQSNSLLIVNNHKCSKILLRNIGNTLFNKFSSDSIYFLNNVKYIHFVFDSNSDLNQYPFLFPIGLQNILNRIRNNFYVSTESLQSDIEMIACNMKVLAKEKWFLEKEKQNIIKKDFEEIFIECGKIVKSLQSVFDKSMECNVHTIYNKKKRTIKIKFKKLKRKNILKGYRIQRRTFVNK